jgi:hypothetical protein
MSDIINDNLGNIIDSKWLLHEERLQNVNSIFDREIMQSITAKFIYINTHDYIDKITYTEIPLVIDNSFSMIPKENLIKIIEDNKLKTENSTYKLLDVLCCNFDIMPSHIQTFSSSDENVIDKKKILKPISPINDVIIQPSTFIFHDINSIYIIFREHDLDKNIHRYKSILKKPNISQKHKQTKKVRINLIDPTIKNNKKRVTRKNYIDIKENK